MWSFRRKKNTDGTVPSEVRDYYQAEKRERIGMAWVLSIITFIVTVLVVLGLFFGGRWAYRQLTDKEDKPTTPAQQAPTKQGSNGSNQDNKKDTSSNSNQSAGQTPTSGTNQTTTPKSNPAPATPAPSTTPQTGPSSPEELPRTGPDVDL